MKIQEILSKNQILPAVTIDSVENAVKLAKAYHRGGLNLMEITFRTSVTTEAIKAIRSEVPDMTVGAGTILTPEQAEEAYKAGAHFGLAPGFNPTTVDAALQAGLPFIPGVTIPSEVEIAFEKGCQIQKLFPVNQLGGVSFLRSLIGPYGHTAIRFIPMGGIDTNNMNEYLALKNVIAVGGSWLCDNQKIQAGMYEDIQQEVQKSLTSLDNY